MRSAVLASSALALAVLALLTVGCSSKQHPRGRSYVGIHYDCLNDAPSRRLQVFQLLADAHVGWIRMNVDWRALQPSASSSWDQHALNALDSCVRLAAQDGLRVDVTLLASPDWARSGGNWRSPPLDPSDYANAAALLAGRYRGRVQAWEIWNEPNSRQFWTGTAADYVSLLRAAYHTVKRTDAEALVVFGGLFRNDTDWLESAYTAGASGTFDVMATHPYPGNASLPVDALDDGDPRRISHVAAVRRLMLQNGDGDKPIWFTEIGWSAPLRVSLARQAELLTGLFTYTRKDLPYVKAIFWFQAVSASRSATPWEHDLELLNDDLGPRPAYEALRSVQIEMAPACFSSAAAGPGSCRHQVWVGSLLRRPLDR